MLGYKRDIWDFLTFAFLFLGVMAFLVVLAFVLGLLGGWRQLARMFPRLRFRAEGSLYPKNNSEKAEQPHQVHGICVRMSSGKGDRARTGLKIFGADSGDIQDLRTPRV